MKKKALTILLIMEMVAFMAIVAGKVTDNLSLVIPALAFFIAMVMIPSAIATVFSVLDLKYQIELYEKRKAQKIEKETQKSIALQVGQIVSAISTK